jgi:DNA-binding transcriptional ArsR family regulator
MAEKLSEEALKMVAERFKALSEPTRLRLLMALQSKERNVGELVKETGATQANVSRHLQYLTDTGILGRRKAGLHVYYFIADPSVFQLCDVVCGSLQSHLSRQIKVFASPGD